jgi:NAD(P)H-hydrate epimerase
LTVAEMNEVDRRGLESVALDVLVGRAGRAVAIAALDLLGGAYGRRIVVVAGRGNNGADGRMAAGILQGRGARVRVIEAGSDDVVGSADLVIDAAYGTGFRGEYTPPPLAPGTSVLAVDIPSGVVGDTGAASGSPWAATRTVTFVALKPGLVQGDGAELAGEVLVADIGLSYGPAGISVVEDADVVRLFPPRAHGGNKWSAAVLVVAGSPGMTGAASFVATAAYRAGAGMVRLGVPGAPLAELPATEAVAVELLTEGWAKDALEVAERCAAVVVGPGLGRADGTAAEVARLVADSPVPVVVDADGLYALGRLEGGRLADSRSRVVLTPHDGEFARLVGEPPGPDRIAAARRLASAAGAVSLLKGPTTAVAELGGADGRVLLGRTGTPQLATAGTGDVLSGIIGAMVGRGVLPFEAAALAAHVHGQAARRGHIEGLVAGDLPELVAGVLSDLRVSATGPGADGDAEADQGEGR